MNNDIAQPDYKNKVEIIGATNEDIRNVIHKNFPKAVAQTKQFAKQFKGSDNKETAYNIWKFLRQHIFYQKDDENFQLVRLPSRFIAEKKGDCKSYSLCAAALLANNNLPVNFIYASYNRFNRTPSHVYVSTTDNNGNKIIVDGVWKFFNSEKKPQYKIIEPMEVQTLSGLNGGIGRHKRKRRFRNFFKKFGKMFKKGLQFQKMLALAPSRRAFRTLVAMNMFGLAKKLHSLQVKAPDALKKFWVKGLGGKYPQLLKSIKVGYNHWAKRHHKDRINGIEVSMAGPAYWNAQRKMLNESTGDGLGLPPVIAGYITAALGIIAAVIPMLKKHGVDKSEPNEPSVSEMGEKTTEIVDQNPDMQPPVPIEGIGELENISAVGRHNQNLLDHCIHNHRKILMHRKQGADIGKISFKKFSRNVKKITLAQPRRAFRTIVALNIGGLANKLARISRSEDAPKLKERWEKIGGKYSALVHSINAGLKRKKKGISEITTAPAASTTQSTNGWVAIATSVIKIFADLFAKHDKDNSGKMARGETTFQKIMAVASEAANQFGAPTKPADELLDEGKVTDGKNEDDTPHGGSTFKISAGVGIGIAAIAAAYFLGNKRKAA